MQTIQQALNLAVQHHQAGNLVQAEQLYRQILQVKPTEPTALHLLGLLAQQVGQYQTAVDLMRQSVAVAPHVAEFHSNLASAYLALKQWDEAAAACAQALRLRSDLPEVHANLGDARAGQQQWAEAIVSYRQALALRPAFAEAHHKLGVALAELRESEQALASYREALRLRPDLVEAHTSLGALFKQLGRLPNAETSYREALRLRPQSVEALNNLGVALTEQSRYAEAEALFRDALRLQPDSALAHYNLSTVLALQLKYDEAQVACEQALRIQPNYAEARNGLATAYMHQGKWDEALAAYRQAIAAKPDSEYIHSNYLFASHFHPRYDLEAILAAHRAWGARFPACPAPAVQRDPGRRLRIGYVSADFREHVMGQYIRRVVDAHEHENFEIFCYANNTAMDLVTEQIRARADHFRAIAGVPDGQVAEQIRRDRIDLLIDLQGHTSGTRLSVFGLKPAPIQVTHFGCCSTSGLPAMDYRLTDAYDDPPGKTEHLNCEKLFRLPHVLWCYQPMPGSDIDTERVASNEIVFASFNNVMKVTDEMIALWSEILKAEPNSRMMVVTGAGRIGDQRVRAGFQRSGISDEQVSLLGRQAKEEYYRTYQSVDICLDSYPVTGCFTTADALWMGVPVVHRAGPAWVSRQGVAILTQVGLEDVVAETPEAYVNIASRLAQDRARLAGLRGQLRERLQASPFMDAAGFTRSLEAAYRTMWESFCSAV